MLGGGTASLGGYTTPGRVPGSGTASLGHGTTQHCSLGGGTTQGSVSQTNTGRWYRLAQAVVSPMPGEPGMGKF